MKLYKLIILIMVLLALSATATYIVLTSEMFDSGTGTNEDTVNLVSEETVLN